MKPSYLCWIIKLRHTSSLDDHKGLLTAPIKSPPALQELSFFHFLPHSNKFDSGK
jgi:hypothetical protein